MQVRRLAEEAISAETILNRARAYLIKRRDDLVASDTGDPHVSNHVWTLLQALRPIAEALEIPAWYEGTKSPEEPPR